MLLYIDNIFSLIVSVFLYGPPKCRFVKNQEMDSNVIQFDLELLTASQIKSWVIKVNWGQFKEFY